MNESVENGAAGRVSWKRVARRIRVPLGFVFAGVFLWLARPNARTLALSLVLVLPGLWLRGYAAGYVKKNAELTMTGPYAYTRNPLYLGSMLIAFGFAAASGRWEIAVALVVLFLAIYLPTILSEEEFLRGEFAGFDAYAAQVPRLIPRLTLRRGPGETTAQESQAGFLTASSARAAARGRFSRERYLHHREYNSVIGAAAIYAALAVRLWFLTR